MDCFIVRYIGFQRWYLYFTEQEDGFAVTYWVQNEGKAMFYGYVEDEALIEQMLSRGFSLIPVFGD